MHRYVNVMVVQDGVISQHQYTMPSVSVDDFVVAEDIGNIFSFKIDNDNQIRVWKSCYPSSKEEEMEATVKGKWGSLGQ
jgi:hypothetical protein